MQVRFADTRPAGDYALVLPVAGKDRSGLGSLGAAQADCQRGPGPPEVRWRRCGASEQYFDDDGTLRRLLVVGTGGTFVAPRNRRKDRRDGSRPAADLGREGRVIDISGLNLDADSAARVGLAAALRSWRHDRYRTKLKENQKPTLGEVVIVGGPTMPAPGTSDAGRPSIKAFR